MLLYILLMIIFAIIGIGVGYAIRKYISEGKINNAEELSKKIIFEAEHEAQTKKKELLVEAKDEIQKIRASEEKKINSQKAELKQLESRVLNREEQIERKSNQVDKKDEKLSQKLESLKEKEETAEKLIAQREEELQKLAGLTKDEGKEILLNEEGMKKTANKKIFIGKPIELDTEKFHEKLIELKKVALKNDKDGIDKLIAEIVPTFNHMKN